MAKHYKSGSPGLKLYTPKEMEASLQRRLGDSYVERILKIKQLNDSEEADESSIRTESKQLQELVEKIKEFCENEINEISPTQVRNIFELIHQRGTHLNKLAFLRPKLAYYAAKADRQKKEKPQLQILALLLDKLLKATKTKAQLGSLRQFMEALLAYHVFATR